MADNTYDKTDRVRRIACTIADGPLSQLRIAAYTVRDPETGEHSNLQFHATFNNQVLAVMGEESATLFARFVTETLKTKETKEWHS